MNYAEILEDIIEKDCCIEREVETNGLDKDDKGYQEWEEFCITHKKHGAITDGYIHCPSCWGFAQYDLLPDYVIKNAQRALAEKLNIDQKEIEEEFAYDGILEVICDILSVREELDYDGFGEEEDEKEDEEEEV